MNDLEHDLHDLLIRKADEVRPAADLWPAIERRARRTRRVRYGVTAAGAALAVSAIGVAAPGLIGVGTDDTRPASTVEFSDGQQTAPVTRPDGVTCETGARIAVPEAADGLRLMADAPPGMTVEGSRTRFEPACGPIIEGGRPVAAYARIDADGTVRQAVTLWADSEPPPAEGPEGPDDPAGIAKPGDTFEPWSWPMVNGEQAQMRSLPAGMVRLWWPAGGRRLSVSASGLDPDFVTKLAASAEEDASFDAMLLGDGFQELTLPELVDTGDVARIWEVSWRPLGDRESDSRAVDSGPYVDLRVMPLDSSWQAGLSTGVPGTDKIVSVNGRAALLTDNGLPSAGVLHWQLDGDTQALLVGSLDGTRESLLPFAETLEEVPADDPRIVAPSF